MISVENIPQELTELPQWVCWDANKVPIDPKTGKNASSVDPSTWSTIDYAHEVYRSDKRCKGLGFVFTKDDPYVGIDLDGCFEYAGSNTLKEAEGRIVQQLDSYTELSPSGNGLHVIVRASLREASKRNGVEVYPHARYFTMTGHIWDFNVDIEDRQDQVDALVAELGGTTREQVARVDIDEAVNQGLRNEWLFHQATTYFHAGKPIEEAETVIRLLNKSCNPPLPEREIRTLLNSAYRRENKAQAAARGITEQIREYIDSLDAVVFRTEDIVRELNIEPRHRSTVRQVLFKMKQGKIIESDPNRSGVWRKLDTLLNPLDLSNTTVEYLPVKYPGGVHGLVNTMPGQIIVVAGDPDAGKSAYAMNLASMNVDDFQINYFSSEMGEVEMKSRLEKMEDQSLLTHPNFRAYARSSNFADVIEQGKHVINIIDYLEVTEEFYKIGTYINQVFRKLNGSIAVICVQKRSRNDELPLGGLRALEKPRLVLAISRGWIKLVKAKNWVDPEKNPNGLVTKFSLVAGCKFIWDRRGWFEPPPKTKAAAAAPSEPEPDKPFTPIDDEPF